MARLIKRGKLACYHALLERFDLDSWLAYVPVPSFYISVSSQGFSYFCLIYIPVQYDEINTKMHLDTKLSVFRRSNIIFEIFFCCHIFSLRENVESTQDNQPKVGENMTPGFDKCEILLSRNSGYSWGKLDI